jgi:hypothetical protein
MIVPRYLRVVRGALLLLLVVVLTLGGPSAVASPPPGATWAVSISTNDVARATANNPLRLSSDQLTRLVINVDNGSGEELRVRSLRIRGDVFGLTFFSYATRLDLVIPPGGTAERRIDLDLDDLSRQATGLIPAEVQLVDPGRKVVDRRPFVSEVDGSLVSVYAVFGLAVAGMTVLLVLGLLVALSRRQLHENRWRRGLQFLPVGLGLGLTATFTLSALSWLTPSASRWVPLVVGLGVAALLVGYFLPGQLHDGVDHHDEARPVVDESVDAAGGARA